MGLKVLTKEDVVRQSMKDLEDSLYFSDFYINDCLMGIETAEDLYDFIVQNMHVIKEVIALEEE